MNGLTYEQAMEALEVGLTIRGASPGINTYRRGVGIYAVKSYDNGASWKGADDHSGMAEHDGAYAIAVPAPVQPAPRDYRAERDALRLRLDEALDNVDQLIANESRYRDIAGEQHRRALAAEAEVKRLSANGESRHSFEECTAAKHAGALRGLATADANLCGAVAVDSDVLLELLDAWQAKQTPPAPQWPAVGETAPWTTVWDHLKAEPRARYMSGGEDLSWGEHNRRPGEMTVMASWRGKEANRWTDDGRGSREGDHTFTRLPDAESP